MTGSTGKSWSLRNRLTIWICALALLPGLATFLLGGLFLVALSSRELDQLLFEEAEETLLALRAAQRPVEALPAVCREHSSHHPTTPLAWRLTDARTGAVLAEAGQASLLAGRAREAGARYETADLGGDCFARTVDGPEGMRLQIVVDGRTAFAFTDRYWLVAGILLAAGVAMAMWFGRLLSKRTAGLLRQVADDVRSAPGGTVLAPRSSAPDEIHAVVASLRAELQRIHAGSEQARLFTAGLAHELRSPLQNLIAQVEVALLRRREPDAYEVLLRSQLDELSELGDAIDNLLTICTTRTAPASVREDFDLLAEAELRLQRERSRAVRESIELQVMAHGDAHISGDREGALRGIRNVVANALDWTPRGGRVQVSFAGEPMRVVVTVDDSGPGVAAEHRARIFEPFYQGPSRLRRRVGYGLGLAIARAAVTEHGGEIGVEQSPLGGARFRLTFAKTAGRSAVS